MFAAMNYGNWAPPLLSVHGKDVDQIIDVIHWFMLVLFVPWLVFLLYCLRRFRARPGHRASYTPIKARISKYAEAGVVVVEAILLLGFSMPVWAAYKNEPPPREKRFEVRVVAEQFQWNFHYPGKDGRFGRTDARLISASNALGLDENDPAAKDDIVTINEIHLPVDRDIYVMLSSKDVIHSFDIPTMRVKQDVIPGMTIPVWFRIHGTATSSALRDQMTQVVPIGKATWYRLRHHVAAKDHTGAGGQVVLARGADLGPRWQDGEETITKLRQAGVTELMMQPRHPLEVICAQLCGNSHFKMKAQLVTHDTAGFEAWAAEQLKQAVIEDF